MTNYAARGDERDLDGDPVSDMLAYDELPVKAQFILRHAPIKYSCVKCLDILQEHGEQILIESLLHTILIDVPGYTAI